MCYQGCKSILVEKSQPIKINGSFFALTIKIYKWVLICQLTLTKNTINNVNT